MKKLILVFMIMTSPIWAEHRPYELMYEQKCAHCHGYDGRGKTHMYRTLKVRVGKLDLSRPEIGGAPSQRLQKVILTGKGKMPSFDKSFHGEIPAGLLDYIKSLSQ